MAAGQSWLGHRPGVSHMKDDYIIKPCPEERMKLAPEKHWDYVARGIVKSLIVRLRIQQQVDDVENLREAIQSGRPVFSFSNHVSWADHFVIMNMIDDHVHIPVSALCKEKYFKYPVFKWFLRRANQIPITNIKLCYARWHKQVKRTPARRSDFIDFITNSGTDLQHEVNVQKRQSLVRTAAHTHDMLDRNRIILGYPEGTRSQRSSMQPIKTGIMQLPFECKACVVPTAITGTDTILPRGIKWYKIFGYYGRDGGADTRVKFGKAIDYSELLDMCQEKFERIEDMVNLENVKILREQIEEGRFRGYTVEAERFERVFDESSLIIMRAVNEILPQEYQTEQVEIKYPR
jgi:1-acyl-sn-glycerol-3-phosphate acyltransferase